MDFFTWYNAQSICLKERPWLILGKGPSFSKKEKYALTGFNIFSLNHVVSILPVDVAHIIDLDVVYACEADLEKNAGILLMPWFPHVNFKPGKKNLDELADEIPVLNRLKSLGRLVWYNKSGQKQRDDQPVIKVSYFSAEAPYALLGMAGVKKIRSLGVDGGASYSSRFSSLNTLLANGRASFNKQFKEIARSIMSYDIDSSPLDMEEPIRIYVATTEEQMLSVKVLEYSIRANTACKVEVYPMHLSDIKIPTPVEQENRPRTPFSFQRFLIPELAEYQGKAIYLDSDMQVFSDIKDLWMYEMHDNFLLSVKSSSPRDRKPQYSVMLLNCAKLDWNIESIVRELDDKVFNYSDLMYSMCVAEKQSPEIPAVWNSLECYVKDQTCLVHYTDMNTQPWIYARNPLGYLWTSALIEAIDTGYIDKAYVFDHIEKGWARPSLKYQIENRVEDALLLPKSILALDDDYSPPYHKISKHSGAPWVSISAYFKAGLRSVFYKSVYPALRALKHRLYR